MNQAPAQASSPGWLDRPRFGRLNLAAILLGLVLLLSLGLHLMNLAAIGDANVYYTAAVKSMLRSGSNFFYLAAEPGGSVAVDKPPLGLWVQAAFAAALGVSGLSVVLPNLIAGVLSLPLLYGLVKRHFGTLAGLLAALALALTPISLAVDRSNTFDGMLGLLLLLTAWAFIRAAETGRLGALLLGAVLAGLAFNLKMMQALLPLPAFYAFYWAAAQMGWRRKLRDLALATLLLVLVSFSWAVLVDLTPADQRPYVGSSASNSEMELILLHNGFDRLFDRNEHHPGGFVSPFSAGPFVPEALIGETGERGLLRLFQPELAKELSWLLPFGLLGGLLVLLAEKVRLDRLSAEHIGLVLWGGWLLTCLVFFNLAGYFHNYHLTTLAPALAALVGAGSAALLRLNAKQPLAAVGLLLAATAGTLAFQLGLVGAYGAQIPLGLAAGVGCAAGALLALGVGSRVRAGLFGLALGAGLAALLLIPGWWSYETAADPILSGKLPAAYSPAGSARVNGLAYTVDASLLAYLQAHTADVEYLVGLPNGQPTGSLLVLASGRPVLFIGGYSGSDSVIDAAELGDMVRAGRLRYVLVPHGLRLGGADDSPASRWLRQHCGAVSDAPAARAQGNGPAETLYRCEASGGSGSG